MAAMSDDAEAFNGADLLAQALRGGLPGAGGPDLDEFVEFQIFFDAALQVAEAGEAAPFLRARLCECFEVFGSDGLERYLWHCDRLVLEVELGDSDDEPHLAGHMRTGDGAEDEWYLTFLLQRLTAARSDVTCRIVDADGELLLIEAALAAPRWLTPTNAEHRVWLRNGQVHLLPRPCSPEPDIIGCREALARLRAAGGSRAAKDKVQHAINARLKGYPKQALELSTHTVRAVLPASVARLLLAFPQLVAVALDNLPPPATRELVSLRKKLNGPAAEVRFDCESVSEKDMICVGIRLTRCQYARLAGMRSQLPQRFTQKNLRPAGKDVPEKCRRVGNALRCPGGCFSSRSSECNSSAPMAQPRIEQ